MAAIPRKLHQDSMKALILSWLHEFTEPSNSEFCFYNLLTSVVASLGQRGCVQCQLARGQRSHQPWSQSFIYPSQGGQVTRRILLIYPHPFVWATKSDCNNVIQCVNSVSVVRVSNVSPMSQLCEDWSSMFELKRRSFLITIYSNLVCLNMRV